MKSARLLLSAWITPSTQFLSIHVRMTFPSYSRLWYVPRRMGITPHVMLASSLRKAFPSIRWPTRCSAEEIWAHVGIDRERRNTQDCVLEFDDIEILSKVDGKHLMCKWCRLSISGGPHHISTRLKKQVKPTRYLNVRAIRTNWGRNNWLRN